MVKKSLKGRLLVVAAAAMVLLTACSSTDHTAGQGAGAGSSSGSAAGTVAEGQDSVQDVSGADGSGEEASNTAAGSQDSSGTVDSGTQVALPQDGDASQDGDMDTQGSAVSDEDQLTDEGTPDAGQPSDAGQDGSGSDIWSGRYVSDSESVTLSQVDSENVSFAFEQSGISGTASVKSSGQAVFNGDDYHVVIFTINGSVLDISVASEEDFDASGSPLIGTYVKSE